MKKLNEIAGFLNQPFLQNKMMKQPNFLHVDTNSENLNVDPSFFGRVWSVWSLDTNIDCIFKMNRWN